MKEGLENLREKDAGSISRSGQAGSRERRHADVPGADSEKSVLFGYIYKGHFHLTEVKEPEEIPAPVPGIETIAAAGGMICLSCGGSIDFPLCKECSRPF